MELAEEIIEEERDSGKEAKIAVSKFPRVIIEQGKNADFWKPWRKSLIVKVLGRTVNFRTFEVKLRELWKLDQYFELIDLENGYFITSLLNKEDYQKVLEGGPWIFQGNYVTISKWKPDFRPTKEDIKTTLAWVRLPELPIEYYVEEFLMKVGNVVGKAVKVDNQTLEVARGKCARICVEVDLKKPLTPFIWVNNDLQAIEYEALDALCFECGQYGHIAANCQKNSANGGGNDAQVNPVAGERHGIEARVAPEANPYGPWILAKQRRNRLDSRLQGTRTQGGSGLGSSNVVGPTGEICEGRKMSFSRRGGKAQGGGQGRYEQGETSRANVGR
ncbi:uncharacterized protein [Coffea arabica]|uniref:CCHC-type domain-containing protein n=1 Tax=Coffea arabica TaxID=13443 RepID=A0A6P6S633_COFAR